MRQAKGMPNLVRGHKTYQFAHLLISKLCLARIGVCCGSLHKIPVAQQLHYVMVPTYMAFQYFTGARIRHVRPVSVLNIRSEIAHHAVTGIFGAKFRVLFWRRGFLADNGVFKPGCFKSLLPVVYALY